MVTDPGSLRPQSTIAAVATPPGTSGVAVIRVSGRQARDVLAALAGRVPEPRRATVADLINAADGQGLDQALILWFPGPASFTGEDVAELQVHGGRAVIAAVLRAVLAVPGVRPAIAGEFTRRAFENGKLDLGAVEGLGDLLQAETESQRRQAYAQYGGAVSDATATVREELVGILALVEAEIDFPDEGDIGNGVLRMARRRLAALDERVTAMIRNGRRGERIRDGLTVAIAGPPNAGKSTLLNALAQRDVAIVSPMPGTTRDTIEVHLDLGGAAVTLLDTAGLRDSDDPVEQEGMARARRRLETADLVLWLEPEDGRPTPEASERLWIIRSQIDRYDDSTSRCGRAISALTGQGIDSLIADISSFASASFRGEPAVLVHERHRLAFEELSSHVGAALALREWEAQVEIVAERLRLGLRALEGLTGRVGSEAILDELFAAFCIGK